MKKINNFTYRKLRDKYEFIKEKKYRGVFKV